LKIALVTHRWTIHNCDPIPFGISLRAAELADYGHELHVLTTPAENFPAGIHADRNVIVHRLQSQSGVNTECFNDACADWCREHKPDVIHIDDPSLVNPWWQEFSKAKRVATVHRLKFSSWVQAVNLRRAGHGEALGSYSVRDGYQEGADLKRLFDSVITTCRYDAWALSSLMGCESKVVYPPIRIDSIDSVSTLPVKQHWLCVSELWEREPADGVREAERAASLAGVQLQSVKRSSTTGQIVVYDECLGVILPTFSTHLPLALAESLARRKPVIATSVGAVALEQLEGVAVVPSGDVQAMANAMNNPPVVQEGAASRWHPKKHAADWLDVVMK